MQAEPFARRLDSMFFCFNPLGEFTSHSGRAPLNFKERIMGWTCTYKPKEQPLTEFFIDHGVFSWSGDNPYRYKVLDGALVNLSEYYAAVECTHKETGERRVWAAIILVTFHQDTYDNFCYKDMDESVGPFVYNCPKRILDLLTPTDHAYAIGWREKCRQNLEAKTNGRKLIASLKIDSIIRMDNPIKFSDGYSSNELKVSRKEGKSLVFNGRYVIGRSRLIDLINEGSAHLVS
jgi:hypothetical protein